jgi:uncharacterized protein (DUF58 family)
MMARMPKTLRQRWSDWWEARMPRQDQIRLTQRNLYILPTRAGWSFAAVVLVLLLASINEQLNLGYALAFLLGGAGMAALYQTHGNLQGVSLKLQSLHSVHAGEVLRLSVALSNQHRRLGRFGLQISVNNRGMQRQTHRADSTHHLELAPGSEGCVEVDVCATQRGWLNLPRLTIETRYPLGLFRAWAFWRPQSRVLIWPALDPHAAPLSEVLALESSNLQTHAPMARDADMPEGLRDHRRGDPLHWVAWKKSSRALVNGGNLVSREPAGGRTSDLWLDYDLSPGMQGLHSEARLSRLASWLIHAEQEASGKGPAYGLRLPSMATSCGNGPHHLRHCLDALATWTPSHSGACASKDDA